MMTTSNIVTRQLINNNPYRTHEMKSAHATKMQFKIKVTSMWSKKTPFMRQGWYNYIDTPVKLHPWLLKKVLKVKLHSIHKPSEGNWHHLEGEMMIELTVYDKSFTLYELPSDIAQIYETPDGESIDVDAPNSKCK